MLRVHSLIYTVCAAVVCASLFSGTVALGVPQYFAGTGHYYEVVQEPLGWDETKIAASSRSFMGVTGHLATVGSVEENAFITNLLPVTPTWDERFALGGYQPTGSPEPNGNWQWLTNETWGYTNWKSGEPNNSGVENYLEIYTHPAVRGTWNDITNTQLQYGYVVEYETSALPQTHVLSVGVRCEENFIHGGDVNSVRVKNAFAQLSGVDSACSLQLNTTDSDNSQQITTIVNAMKAKVQPGDTFVFYLNGHGYEDWATDEVITPGDERFYLSLLNSSDDMTDDTFSSLFQTDEWNQVNKLFIIDTYYAKSFIGNTANGDSGDLTQLPNFALFAACDEDETSVAVYDSESDTYVGALGKALIAALNEFRDQDVITFQELYDETAYQGSFLVGSSGRIQGFKDLWGDEIVVDFDLHVSTSDDFVMDSPFAPEPATLWLLAIGGAALLKRKRK